MVTKFTEDKLKELNKAICTIGSFCFNQKDCPDCIFSHPQWNGIPKCMFNETPEHWIPFKEDVE